MINKLIQSKSHWLPFATCCVYDQLASTHRRPMSAHNPHPKSARSTNHDIVGGQLRISRTSDSPLGSHLNALKSFVSSPRINRGLLGSRFHLRFSLKAVQSAAVTVNIQSRFKKFSKFSKKSLQRFWTLILCFPVESIGSIRTLIWLKFKVLCAFVNKGEQLFSFNSLQKCYFSK